MGPKFFIENAWLNEISDKKFFYPCAGRDWDEPVCIFGSRCSELWFCDINYSKGLEGPEFTEVQNVLDWKITTTQFRGNLQSELTNVCGYRNIDPCWRSDTLERSDGSECKIIRRRGFGEIALHDDIPDESLGVFMHRRDSPGESGSNVFFFKNFSSKYEKRSNLATLVTKKVARKAIIITDGSNAASNHHITRFNNQRINGNEAYAAIKERTWIRDELKWTCVGYLTNGYGPTLAWGVEKVG